MEKVALIFIIFAAVVFGVIIVCQIIGGATRARYNKQADFGYKVDKTKKVNTGLPVLDEILSINPEFKTNGLDKTNLCDTNRQAAGSGTILTYAQAADRFPEEKVRLECYLKCLKKFGKNRVEVEYPIQVGSKKCFLDVAVFAGDEKDQRISKEHSILNLKFIFECKKSHANPNNKTPKGNPETMKYLMASGLSQLKSYMAVCPNLCEKTFRDDKGVVSTKLIGVGCLTNGIETHFYKKFTNMDTGNTEFEEIKGPNWY